MFPGLRAQSLAAGECNLFNTIVTREARFPAVAQYSGFLSVYISGATLLVAFANLLSSTGPPMQLWELVSFPK